MTKTIKFHQSDQSKWGEYQSQVSAEICEKLASHKDFEVTFDFIKPSKNYQQIKGIHKLCSLLVPRFSEMSGVNFDLEAVKLAMKWKLGYLRPASNEECLAEALNIKAEKGSVGIKLTTKEFKQLVEGLIKNKQEPKSFAEATFEEMKMLISEIERWTAQMGWTEIKLESDEKRALVEYYEQLKKE